MNQLPLLSSFPVTEHTDLDYHGRELTAEPLMTTLADLAGDLHVTRYHPGNWVNIVLEPGDATRYALGLRIRGDTLLVVRHADGQISSEFVGAIVLNWRMIAPVSTALTQPLANNNLWSNILLTWWLAQLCCEMQEIDG